MPLIMSLLTGAVAQKIAAKIVIIILRHLAKQSENTLDDQIVDEIEKHLGK